MSAPFSDILRGDPARLDKILEGDYGPLDEQELRAAMQNLLSMVIILQRKVERLEKRVFPGMQ